MSNSDSTTHVTAERLRELFNYDPETGVFTRRIATGYRGCKRAGTVVGGIDTQGYVVMGVDSRHYRANRMAWLYVHGELSPDLDIDHINRIPHDNRIRNLRPATVSRNLLNITVARSDSTIGVRGVRPPRFPGLGFQARFRQKHLGTFATIEEASAAYQAAKAAHDAEAVLVP